MLVGYARIAIPVHSLAPQVVALEQIGCAQIFHDVASGTRADRPELTNALEILSPRDTLVVCKLDRIARSIKHVIELIRHLHDRRVEFCSLYEGLDTTRHGTVFHTMDALAQLDSDLVRNRTQGGLMAARARGRTGGRPRALDEKRLALARRLYKEGRVPPLEICRQLGISRATLYRYLSPKRGRGSGSGDRGDSLPALGPVG